jgi:hypothetical protein
VKNQQTETETNMYFDNYSAVCVIIFLLCPRGPELFAQELKQFLQENENNFFNKTEGQKIN